METMGVSARHCLQNFKGRRSAKSLIFWEKTGAGEGIRTLDPNLGKDRLRGLAKFLRISPRWKTLDFTAT